MAPDERVPRILSVTLWGEPMVRAVPRFSAMTPSGSDRDYHHRWSRGELVPGIHQCATLLEQVAPEVQRGETASSPPPNRETRSESREQ
jgi:hypothetical protein